ncbi:hypothetical protein B0H21DRAFT_742474 [Amylocystis lapponica]|nr:hypothetical protein B0H21DRAFT_742474 [Amylocystis lapponica]
MLEHSYECSYCRTSLKKESFKMCAGCKVMGYCSKDGAKTGKIASSRNPAIKIAERIATDQDIMAQIDGLLISALDLYHHPENAKKYAVALSCQVENTDVHMARDHIMAMLAGRERPPMPDRIPKLFQIGKVARLENKDVPEPLDRIAVEMTGRVKEQGYLTGQSGCQEVLVRAMWVANDAISTIYFCRLVTKDMVDEVEGWKKPDEDGEPTEESPLEDLVKLFDLRALQIPI